jgi:hypothetical protein
MCYEKNIIFKLILILGNFRCTVGESFAIFGKSTVIPIISVGIQIFEIFSNILSHTKRYPLKSTSPPPNKKHVFSHKFLN